MTFFRYLNQAAFAAENVAGTKGNRTIYRIWVEENLLHPYSWE